MAMKTVSKLLLSTLLALLGAQVGCAPAPEDGMNCTGGKCDNLGEEVAGRLGDPVAKLALQTGDSCPSTYADVMAKLRENDKTGCDQGGRAGINTFVVSERSQTLGKPDS